MTVVIFILGCFLDFFEIAFILVPLLAPVAETLGIDLVWFGVILSMNLQTSFLTPPFGFALFYLRSVAPWNDRTDKVTGDTLDGIRTAQIYKGVLPYIVIQFLLILLVISVPSLVTHYSADRQAQQQSSAAEREQNGTGGSSGFNFGGSGSGTTAPQSEGEGNGGFNFGGGSSSSEDARRCRR